MYRAAEKQLNEGLSPFSRFLLGSISGLFGVMMILIAPPTNKEIFFYAFGGFCLVISLACLFQGRIRQFLGSIIGSVLVILSGFYLSSQIIGGGPLFSARSDESIVNAILFSVFLGVPGFTYAIKAKFGLGRQGPNKASN